MSATGPGIVIVGAGAAALACAEALRSGGYAGSLTMIGDEPHAPYHRPPLSKAWLAGEMAEAQLAMRAPELLERKGIALRTACRVLGIDRAARTLRLDDGTSLPYTGLVLATGASPRPLPLPGAEAVNVLALRTRDQASRLATELDRCAREDRPLVVVGGGFIGLEVAATARQRGVAVTVVEAAPRLLGRVLAPALGDWFARLHAAHGVALEMGAVPAALRRAADGRVDAIVLQDGRIVEAGLVLVGIGVLANDQLAREAGLACDRGVVVDEAARTADPLIVACGDCTARQLADGTLLRLESVNNATEQGRSAAAALLGQTRAFQGTPWFWSDQHGRKLQMAGLSTGADAWVVRGQLEPVAAGPLSVWHLRAGRLVAVDTVDDPKTHLLARKLLDAGLTPPAAQLADPAWDPASLLKSA